MLAALLPTLLVVGLAAATGQLDAMGRRYFLQNLFYVGTGESATISEAMGHMWLHAQNDGRFPLLFGTAAAGLVAAAGYLGWRRVRPSSLLIAGGALTLAAVAVVVAPRREYVHYLLLVTVPVILWFGAAVGHGWQELAARRPRLILAGAALVAGLLPLVTRAWHSPPPVYGGFMHHWKFPRSGAGMVLHALAGRDATLAIWGWGCFLHVETGLPQATRDGTTIWSIRDHPQQAYHRQAYLADLQRNAPDFFVDTAGPGSFVFTDRAHEGHEIFPELAAYIRTHYRLLVDLQSERIYARNDLPAAHGLSRERLWNIIAEGRSPERFMMSLPDSSLAGLQQKIVGGRKVVMLLPPARIEWQLDAAIREVSLEFGYDPVAYERGHSNGTELFLEIVGPDATIPVFQRFLDPARRPADRGPQRARETLPPFPPGSRLVLRSEAGPHDDTAWDWVYLASLRLERENEPE